ncbi:MAG: glycosyltransferase [Candidatus Kapaibacterium sp.]|nr:MAG: glycosyltransferase [Candidatus Kapabacteria bacterium]
MMMNTIQILCLLAAGVYLVRTLVFVLGIILERRKQAQHIVNTSFQPFVSVVVPARNEEGNIERCVRSLMQSTYPANSFEVIIVNDRSEDRTGEILSGLQTEFPHLVVHNTEVSEGEKKSNLQGKPRAVHQGIMRSRGEIVCMTDADCEIPPTWIRAIARMYARPEVGLVAAFTLVSGNRFFDKLQMLEWTINNTMASAGVGLKQPLGCFGNNLSVRRSVYEALGGYERIPFSVTEDLALLQAVFNAGHEVCYVCSPETGIQTMPCPDIASFSKQHQRWVNGGKALGWRGRIFVVSSLLIWIGLVPALLQGAWLWALGLVLVRILANMLLTFHSFVTLRMASRLWLMPFAEPFFLLIELAMPFWAMKSKVEWKGQILRNH